MRRRHMAAFAKYGEIFRLKLFRSYVILTIDPKIFQKIANSTTSYLAKASNYALMEPFIGDGLLISSGCVWQAHRKAIQPAFNVNTLREYVEVFDRKSKLMIESLKMRGDGTLIDIEPFSSQLSCDIVMETLMAIDTSDKNDNSTEFTRTVTRLVFFFKSNQKITNCNFFPFFQRSAYCVR